MKPGHGTRSLIQSCYPGREALIERGLSDCPVFHELCEDYRRCFVTLENLRQPGAAGNLERVQEYEQLLAELGREVDGWLESVMQDRD